MDAFREPQLRRRSRQAVTLTRAICAGRTRAKSSPPQSRQVHSPALRDLVADVAAESELVEIAASRRDERARTGARPDP